MMMPNSFKHNIVTLTLTSANIVLILLASLDSSAEAKPNRKVPIVLDESNWTQLLQGEWMFDLYAPWCPACKRLEPEWRKFAEWSDDLNINVAFSDVTINPALSGRFMVRGLPTIYHVKDGIFRIYNGPREHAALINFIEEQGWKAVEPVSRWLAPDTLQMSFLAFSFRISMTLRDVHNHMVENVGLPYYVSYLIIALCTVTLGTLLGILIVFIIDLFYPSNQQHTHSPAAQQTTGAKKGSTKKKDDADQDKAAAKDDSKAPSDNNEQVRRRVKS